MNNSSMAPAGRTSFVQTGGALGIAACFIGLAIFMAACFGFSAVFMLSLLPFALGCIGIVLTVIGATIRKSHADADTAPLSAIFVNIMGIV
ncbi:MAG: hypothetical protein ACREJC_10400, partial [Tepidisphaeraceae bacterium]